MTTFLTTDFLSNYPSQPSHMNELGLFTAYRTYCRWLEAEGRRETWKEAVARAVDYSIAQQDKRMTELKFPFNRNSLIKEAEALFDSIFNLKQFLSGRTHWVGGAETSVADKFPLANFNCSFIEIKSWEDLSELFYLLLVGTGVGFKATKEGARALGAIRNDLKIIHADYEPVDAEHRLELTELKTLDNGYTKMYVGDSKEGWVGALKDLFMILTKPEWEGVHTLKISYNSIRPKGEKLKTFGGTASGHEPLKEMFEGIMKVIRGEIDPTIDPPEFYTEVHEDGISTITDYSKVYLRPVHILDIGNLIGNNVVVGGVRRTAEIFLADADDWESILAKYGINGIWDDQRKTAKEKHESIMNALEKVLGYIPGWMNDLTLNSAVARPMHHRRMSNNSVGFMEKPSREMLNLLFTIMQNEGEPGFINLESANRRRPNAKGLNPCAEILLDSYGVCNLTTINVKAFVVEQEGREPYLDITGLAEAQSLSVRAGMRMTLLDLELPHWNEVHKRDRLLGTSLTGWYDAMDTLGFTEEQEKGILTGLQEIAVQEATEYATGLRIPLPLLITTVKPEGTLSQVAGGVSSGLHRSHSPFYKRRIRINANDALVSVARDLGWTIHAEVGTNGFLDEENLSKPEQLESATTVVVTFPVKSGAKKTKDDITVDEQFDTYFNFQKFYSHHNSSNTITVKPDEWARAEEIVWENWDDFIGVSFLAHDGGSYTLAPYEACTEEEYEALKASMGTFEVELLHKYEGTELSEDLDVADCSTGACPIR